MPGDYGNVVILRTNESLGYADRVYAHLRERVEKEGGSVNAPKHIAVRLFSDREKRPRVRENIRGKHAYYIHNCVGDDGEYHPDIGLMKAGITGYAIRNSRVSRLVYVMPYFPYQRQDRMDRPRVPITAKFALHMLNIPPSDIPVSLITFDMHTKQAVGFVDYTIENLPTESLFADYFEKVGLGNFVVVGVTRPDEADSELATERAVKDFNEAHTSRESLQYMTVISPDTGGATRARSFAKRFGAPIAIIDKRRQYPGKNEVMHIVGREYVKGRVALILDDIIDTAGTMIKGANALYKAKAIGVIGAAPHGLFSAPRGKEPTEERIRKTNLKIVTANTIVRQPKYLEDNSDWLVARLETESLAGEIIYRMHGGLSVSELFDGDRHEQDDDDLPVIY